MRVLKFGGSSLAGAEKIDLAIDIVRRHMAEDITVAVVSAMAGATDSLLRIGELAIYRQSIWREKLQEIEGKYAILLNGCAEHWRIAIQRLAANMQRDAESLQYLHVIAAEEEAARFSGWGERLMALVFAARLCSLGIPAYGYPLEPVMLYGAAQTSDRRASALATRAWLAPQLASAIRQNAAIVLPGYIARDPSGKSTTLGRNASDYSATLIGAALGATGVYIYSDVAGLYTEDPKVNPQAQLISYLTFEEALSVTSRGVKALHPRAVEPAAQSAIPVKLRSLYAPFGAGTDIGA